MIGRFATACGMRAARTGTMAVGVAGTLLFAASFGPALAQSSPATPTEDWRVVSVAQPDGQFAYCVARNVYSGNVIFSVARTPQGVIAILMAKPGAKYKVGEVGSKLRIDTTVSGQGKANVRSPETIEIVAGNSPQFFDALRKGSVLYVDTDVENFALALRGTGKALGDLATCVDSKGKSGVTEAAAAPAPGGGAPAGGQQTQVDMAVPAKVRTVMESVGYGGMVPLAASPGNRVWAVVASTVQEVKTDGKKDMVTLRTEVAADLQRACRGTFKSEFDDAKDTAGGKSAEGFASCALDGRETYIALLLYLNKDNALYIFSHEGNADQRDRLNRERDAIAEALGKAS